MPNITESEVTWSIYPNGKKKPLMRGSYNNITFSCSITGIDGSGWKKYWHKLAWWWGKKKILWAINMLHFNHIHEWPYLLPYPCEQCHEDKVQKHRNGAVVCVSCNWDQHNKEFKDPGWEFEEKPDQL